MLYDKYKYKFSHKLQYLYLIYRVTFIKIVLDKYI